jgi:hypothetical protein
MNPSLSYLALWTQEESVRQRDECATNHGLNFTHDLWQGMPSHWRNCNRTNRGGGSGAKMYCWLRPPRRVGFDTPSNFTRSGQGCAIRE